MEKNQDVTRGSLESDAPEPSDHRRDSAATQSSTSDAEQAVINQEKAFESGEENPA